MVLRIQKVSDGQLVIVRLSGRVRSEDVDQLKEQIEGNSNRVLLDLAEVKLVDRDVVLFLADCEAKGVQLGQCPPYIREWIDRERATQGSP